MREGDTEVQVKISNGVAEKDPILEKAIRSLESKMSAIGLDGEVARDDGSPDMVKVKIYADNPLEPIRKTLFTTFQLELRQIAVGQYSYETEAQAKANAKGDQ